MQNPKPRRNEPEAKACGNCAYLKSTSDDGGECRRNPPQLVMSATGLTAAFPGVRKADIWCGEWKV